MTKNTLKRVDDANLFQELDTSTSARYPNGKAIGSKQDPAESPGWDKGTYSLREPSSQTKNSRPIGIGRLCWAMGANDSTCAGLGPGLPWEARFPFCKIALIRN